MGKGQQAKDIFLQEVTEVPIRSVHVLGGEIRQGSCRGGTRRAAGIPKSLIACHPHIAGPPSEWSDAHSFDTCSPPSGLFCPSKILPGGAPSRDPGARGHSCHGIMGLGGEMLGTAVSSPSESPSATSGVIQKQTDRSPPP